MTASNDVNQPLTTFLADELMTSWRAGMCVSPLVDRLGERGVRNAHDDGH